MISDAVLARYCAQYRQLQAGALPKKFMSQNSAVKTLSSSRDIDSIAVLQTRCHDNSDEIFPAYSQASHSNEDPKATASNLKSNNSITQDGLIPGIAPLPRRRESPRPRKHKKPDFLFHYSTTYSRNFGDDIPELDIGPPATKFPRPPPRCYCRKCQRHYGPARAARAARHGVCGNWSETVHSVLGSPAVGAAGRPAMAATNMERAIAFEDDDIFWRSPDAQSLQRLDISLCT